MTTSTWSSLSLAEHGATLHKGVASMMLGSLEAALSGVAFDRAGVRLHGLAALTPLLETTSPVGAVAVAQLGPDARPVRAILFDKTPGANWTLDWHQDRTVALRARHDVPGWAPWSLKGGVHHVEPPFALIERLVTLRVHLDPVPLDNAPLLIALGSHRLGRVPTGEVEAVVRACGTLTCLADRGDAWAYATPILHASAASAGHAHRRVLQVDYSAERLPTPLAWLGI